VVSNQFLFDNVTPVAALGGLTEFQYINSHWVFTDHTQLVTGSAGAWYQFCGRPAYANETFWGSDMSWCGTRLTGDMIYGSGLRSDVANLGTNPPYTQFNIGVAREFLLFDDPRPMTVRFDIVNLFDSIYEIRSGSGIGVFAPQFGPRRGYFFGVSKKL
jgi:TonB dependent receptor